jgi:hypothetical protein
MTPKPRNATFAIVLLPAEIYCARHAYAAANMAIGHLTGGGVNTPCDLVRFVAAMSPGEEKT